MRFSGLSLPLFHAPVIRLISAIYRPVSLLLLSCYFADKHLKTSSQAVGNMNLHRSQVERIPLTIAFFSLLLDDRRWRLHSKCMQNPHNASGRQDGAGRP